MAQSTIIAVPESFKGNQDFDTWLKRFEVCATANGWNSARRLAILPAKLVGRAFHVYEELGDDQKDSYEHLTAALKEKFTPAGMRSVYEAQFRNRARKSEESVDDYLDAIRQLLRKAYPNMDEDTKQTMIREQFIRGFEERIREKLHWLGLDKIDEIAKRVKQWEAREKTGGAKVHMPSDVSACLNDRFDEVRLSDNDPVTEQRESCWFVSGSNDGRPVSGRQQGMPRLPGRSGTTRNNVGERGRTSLRCFRCGKIGHVRRDCTEKVSVREQYCFECGGVSHIRSECPVFLRRQPTQRGGRRQPPSASN